jgi:hypothetical protein
MLTYYVQPPPLDWLFERIKRCSVFIAYGLRP